MNQQAQSNYNTGIVQSSFRTEHHQSNFKTLSQISQQSQPQATTPVGDVACSFWSSDQRHRGFKPTSNIFELVALKHLDGESWRINVRPNLLSSSYEATFPPPWRPQNFGVMKRIAKYCKILQIYANMFESLRLLQTGWLHGHRKHQKTLPSAGQRPLQLPARVRSTQKSSPRRFSTRAYKSNCSCSANLRRSMKEPFYDSSEL